MDLNSVFMALNQALKEKDDEIFILKLQLDQALKEVENAESKGVKK